MDPDSKLDTTTPVRLRLSGADLAASFRAIRAVPPATGWFEDLPEPGDLRPELRDASGQLRQPVAAAVRVLADAAQGHSLHVYRPADGRVATASIASSASGTSVMMNRDGDEFDLAVLDGRDQTLAVLTALMDLPVERAPDPAATTLLSLPALAATAVLADRLRDQALRAELDRRPGVVPSAATDPLDLNVLVEGVASGLDRPDLRSSVSLLAVLTDGALEHCRSADELEAGMRALGEAGFVDESSVPTAGGVGLAVMMGGAVSASRLLSVTGRGEAASLSRIVCWRTPTDVLTGRWRGDDDGVAIELAGGPAAIAVQAVWDLLASAAGPSPDPARAAASQATCPACDAVRRPANAFCHACGFDFST